MSKPTSIQASARSAPPAPIPVWLGALLFLAAWAVCMALIPWRRPGGDSEEMIKFVQWPVSIYYYRSPLTMFLHRGVYALIRSNGLGADQAIALCSAAAGGVYLMGLLSICRRPLFLAFNLLAGTTFLFFGHIENYAWVNALLVLYFALFKRHLARGAPLWPAALALMLACLFHLLAVFTLPTLLFGVWKWDRTARRPVRRIPDGDFQKVLLIFVAATIFVVAVPAVFAGMGLLTMGLDNNFQRLTPLFHNPNPMWTADGEMREGGRYLFTMFCASHFKLLAHFHWMASPAGLLVLLILGWRIRGAFQKFLLGATACGLFWTFIWHPDMGQGDWDLFSSFAFPLNILDGLLLAQAWQSFRSGARREKTWAARL